MRSYTILLTAFLISCGTSKSEFNEEASGAKPNFFAMTVETLPDCSAVNDKQLVYNTTTYAFYSCESGTWIDIDLNSGSNGEGKNASLSILENKLIQSSETNICNEFDLFETCVFNGGQIIKFSDGSVFINGTYSYQYIYSEDYDEEYDRLTNSVTIIVPPNVDGAYMRLDWAVSREGEYFENLFLVYDRSDHKVFIVFDTDGDLEPNMIYDEIVLTPKLINW